jgi:hypothetical protein
MTKVPKPEDLEETKSLMQALLGMKPKPHEDMKIGKKKRRSKNPSNKAIRTKVDRRS